MFNLELLMLYSKVIIQNSKLYLLCALGIFAATNTQAQRSTIDKTAPLVEIDSPKVWGEKSFLEKAISIPPEPNKGRIIGVTSAYAATWTGTLIALNEIWYKGYPKSKFHSFDDSGEWLQVDKVGHAYSGYKLTQYFTTALRWTGIPKQKTLALGAAGGFLSLSVIEILDGYSAKWGFSWSDIGANAAGSGLYAGQEALWGEQRIRFRFSNRKEIYPEGQLAMRAADLYGTSRFELLFKDYNAQTYWLSANLKSFLPKSNLPNWLNVAVGYGATGMYGGFENKWTDEENNIAYDRTDIPRLRQFYIAPDIDFSRINTRYKFLNKFLDVVNLKLPLPTLGLNSDGKLKFYPSF